MKDKKFGCRYLVLNLEINEQDYNNGSIRTGLFGVFFACWNYIFLTCYQQL
jgi:hypothetical protein